jgi:hypothetical protein
MNLTQKISQMTPKGADLAATDLIEVSTLEAGSYVTKSITGQELIDAIPLPPTGLTVGTTPIASGTIGRVLFQGTGNVLQQSSSLFWDNTGFLGIGTSTPNAPSTYSGITINSATAGSYIWFQNAGTIKYSIGSESNVNYHNLTAGTSFLIRSGGSSYFNVVQSTGNVQIGTTTDAGFRLDVNGTARVQGNATVQSLLVPTTNLYDIGTLGVRFRDGYFKGILLATEMYAEQFRFAATNYKILNVGGTQIAQWFGTGNLLIQNGGTFTDAGFRLDVNGTARVDQTLQLNGTSTGTLIAMGGNIGRFTIDGLFIRFKVTGGGDILNMTTNFFGVNQTSTISSAIMAITSTDRGFLPPRMTTTQKNAIASPAAGLVVYDNTDNKHYGYNGTTWNAFY